MNQPRSVMVLGAGMVGVCTALHVQARGCAVTLVDRSAPGRETSFGNAGIIQREAAEPYSFPWDAGLLMRVLLGRASSVRVAWGDLPRIAPAIMRYAGHSLPARYAAIATAYHALIAHCQSEHAPLMAQAHAESLVEPTGFRMVFAHAAAFDAMARHAERMRAVYGIQSRLPSRDELMLEEPALQGVRDGLYGGAVHWTDSWRVSDPGDLVARYAALFERNGGVVLRGDAMSLRPSHDAQSWCVDTEAGGIQAEQAVIALGPWSAQLTRRLGYRLPLFVKRGYHAHYAQPTEHALKTPTLNIEAGFLLAPMTRGIRLSTGAEFAALERPASPVQLTQVEPLARRLVDLGACLDDTPWLGARPCTVDMLPIMGAAPRHAGLWFNFGHAHQGFTLGPVAGRLLAELIVGEPTIVDATPYRPNRF